MNPFPLILSSPSGGGKTTIARMLLERRPDVGYSVSCTTRAPRPGEQDRKDYYFLSAEDFEARKARGEFAEWAVVHGNLYGTLRQEITQVLASGRHVIMDIDVQGRSSSPRRFPSRCWCFYCRRPRTSSSDDCERVRRRITASCWCACGRRVRSSEKSVGINTWS